MSQNSTTPTRISVVEIAGRPGLRNAHSGGSEIIAFNTPTEAEEIGLRLVALARSLKQKAAENAG